MYSLSFECEGQRIFNIRHKNYPLPRIGDLITFNVDHFIVVTVRHRFATIQGPESTGIVVYMRRSRERELFN